MSIAETIARAKQQAETVPFGPWLGAMRSRSAEQVPPDFVPAGSNSLYKPSDGTWTRRLGQTQVFDTFGAAAGMLPAKWGAKCRQLEEFEATGATDGLPSVIALLTKEENASPSNLEDGKFANVWTRNQVANTNYTLGSDYSGTTYPTPGTEASYKVPNLWYDSGGGGMLRGVSEFQRRFIASGSRHMLRVGRWWYFPALNGVPVRWDGITASSTTALRIMPTGPLPPLHAGTLAADTVIIDSANYARPDADITDGTWTGQDAGTSLFSYIDEESANDTDYIRSVAGTDSDTCEVRLSDYSFTPAASDKVTVRMRVRRNGSTGVFLTGHLVEGTTIRASWTITSLPTGFQNYSRELTSAEITSITDWTNLRLRFVKTAIPVLGTSRAEISFAALEHQYGTNATDRLGGWRGSDRFYYSVAYRFEDDSVWMPCLPREPNATLASGFNLFTVDGSALSASYQKVVWSNIPIGPNGVIGRVLLRSPKIDSTTESTLQLNPYDLRVVWEIKDNSTTTYEMFAADDDALGIDVNELLIRTTDQMMAPRARYIFGGDSRVCHAYGGLNPCAIVLAPIGHTADYDLNLDDDAAALWTSTNSSYFKLDATNLTLVEDTGAGTSTTAFALATYTTLEKLVDAINDLNVADDGRQWRAQVAPGANPQAATSDLTPTIRSITGVSISGTALTKAGGGLSAVPVGSFITGTGITNGTYVTAIVSDTALTMSASGSTGTQTLNFVSATGDAITGATNGIYEGYVRVISNSLPGFLYFNTTYLDRFPIEKNAVWMTTASPGSVKSAANAWSNKTANKHTPPLEAGMVMGGGAVDNGFVVPYSQRRAVIRNTRDSGTGVDSDYRMFVMQGSSGCCAWGSVVEGDRFVGYFSPEGWVGADLFDEHKFSDAIWRHQPATGDYTYEQPICVGDTAADTDDAYIMARIMRRALYVNYRASGTHPNRQSVYDYSANTRTNGLAALARSDGTPWGWSTELVRSCTAMTEARRGDGSHLYAWNDGNAGSTGDGRIDEIETAQTDNGTPISASVVLPWVKFDNDRLSGQEVVVEHSTPSGATVSLTFVRSYSLDSYSFTPSTSSTLVVSRDHKMLTLPARSPTAAGYWQWAQTAGTASEFRRLWFKVKRLMAYK